MKRIPEVYPEIDIREDKSDMIIIYLCFFKSGTIAVKASHLREIRERFAKEPAFHVIEIIGGQLYYYLAGTTKIGNKEILLVKRECLSTTGKRRLKYALVVQDNSRPLEPPRIISSQRRLPHEYMRQLESWHTTPKEENSDGQVPTMQEKLEVGLGAGFL